MLNAVKHLARFIYVDSTNLARCFTAFSMMFFYKGDVLTY